MELAQEDIQLNASTPIDNFVPKIMTAAGHCYYIHDIWFAGNGTWNSYACPSTFSSSSFPFSTAVRLALQMQPVRVHDKFGFIYRADQWHLGVQGRAGRRESCCYLYYNSEYTLCVCVCGYVWLLQLMAWLVQLHQAAASGCQSVLMQLLLSACSACPLWLKVFKWTVH